MYRRPISISILGGGLSIASIVAFFLALNKVFLSDDPLGQAATDSNALPAGIEQLVSLLSSLIIFVCTVNIMNGVNWARWLFVVTCVGLFGFDLYWFSAHFLPFLPGVIFRVVFIFFLFMPDANDFFASPP